MSNITQELKDRIKDASNIVDVIGSYLSLRKKGVNFVGVCPFHDDNSPSMIVSPNKNMYKCFSCGAGGDVIKFVQEHEHISFIEALKSLAKRASIEVPETEISPEERLRIKERESLRNVILSTHVLYKQNLLSNTEAMAYVRSRGIEQETISLFGLGYAENKNDITAMASGAGYNKALFEKIGLIKRKDGNAFDAFRYRVMYPFYDLSGNVCGFTGRHIAYKKGDPFGKFVNSDDSDLFHKERLVYGLFQTKKFISENDKAYLVEGQNDVLSMFQSGVKNVAGGSGTAFSQYQAKLIMRFTRNITIMYDGDAAGLKATMAAMNILLAEGANVRIVRLPEGEDPDSFARKTNPEIIKITFNNLETDFVDFLFSIHKPDLDDIYKKEAAITETCTFISLMPNESLRKEMIKKCALLYKVGVDQLNPKLKSAKTPPSKWSDGFYGIEEAKEMVKNDGEVYLTFNEKTFLNNYENEAYIYACGNIRKDHIQYLCSNIKELTLEQSENSINFDEINEHPHLSVLAQLYRHGMKLEIEYSYKDSEESTINRLGFVDYYVTGYGRVISMKSITENTKAQYIDRCAEIISCAENTLRTVMLKSYAKQLEVGQSDLKAIIAPYLAKKKDKATLESKRLDTESELLEFDPEKVPSYVNEDKAMNQIYQRDRYYPLLNKEKLPVSYMFRNDKGGGHTCISDFYMEALLHIKHKESTLNKRVIQLNHMHMPPRYVEWQSSFMANLAKLNEKFIEEGSYNFDGSMNQWKAIWRNMSYKFTACTELRTFGQQPEEFWAFTNAILHDVDGKLAIEYTNKLGVTTHKGENYYSPAFSEIFAHQRRDDDQYELDRYFVYKEVPDSLRIEFNEWADLMNKVYAINDNGKWAVLFSMLACFRDFIFSNTRFFTTLFFIGPTGSGKSQVAFSMRSLFMSPDAPVFNLNSGTDAAFFMLLERNRNVLSIMEEYNDTNISQAKFQGLKSAVLDGQGKTKIKDMNNKTLDSSKINAVPLPLGQEAPQQDDGSLSNRSILCDVPYNPNGEFTQEEKDMFNKLKSHERAGLCNVLVQVLSLRPVIKEHYMNYFNDEIKKINTTIRSNISNNEGLDRVINSVGLVSALCKLIEDHTSLQLPFTYSEFYQIACEKVLKQMEIISTSNKQSTYFNTISFLINQGSLKIGKDLKVIAPGKITIMKSGKETETISMSPIETKVLFIDFEAIYPLYVKSVKDAMTRASLKAYFASNKSYLGLCKSTQFKWFEEKSVPHEVVHDDGTKSLTISRIMEPKKNNTSAYMFNYDILKDLMNIDFERTEDEEPNNTSITNNDRYTPDLPALPF